MLAPSDITVAVRLSTHFWSSCIGGVHFFRMRIRAIMSTASSFSFIVR